VNGYDPKDDITEKLERARYDALDVNQAWIAETCVAAKLEIERLRAEVDKMRREHPEGVNVNALDQPRVFNTFRTNK
jgi:hypothetical protein